MSRYLGQVVIETPRKQVSKTNPVFSKLPTGIQYPAHYRIIIINTSVIPFTHDIISHILAFVIPPSPLRMVYYRLIRIVLVGK
ncbi:hypothetical protein SDC9_193581 [bioreactor metagenome]|uniref:Uncharacterized protein n=1 Tax=bioreactor metagenome TaxID=1076179 RepID=A0A645I5F5_9ZZZZ